MRGVCVSLCVCVIERGVGTILGCFWWFNFIIYVFTSTWKGAAVPSGLCLFFFSLLHTHFSFLFHAKNTHSHKSVFIQPFAAVLVKSLSALFFCVLFDGIHTPSILPLCRSWADAARFPRNPTRSAWVCMRSSPCSHVLALLFNESTCCVCPLHSPIGSMASWLCQRGSCHGISANPINQTVH